MTDSNMPNGASDPNHQASASPPPQHGGSTAPPPPPGSGYGDPSGDPYQPAPGYGVPPPAANPFGGLGKRFLARLIDYLLIGIPLGIILTVLGLSASGLVYNIITTAVLVGYFLFMETSKGGTFGKTWLGMSVTDQNGSSPITMDASLRRNWWMLLNLVGGVAILNLIAGLASLVIVILIAVTISSDPRNQGWHDKLGNTLVLDRPPAPQGAPGAQQ